MSFPKIYGFDTLGIVWEDPPLTAATSWYQTNNQNFEPLRLHQTAVSYVSSHYNEKGVAIAWARSSSSSGGSRLYYRGRLFRNVTSSPPLACCMLDAAKLPDLWESAKAHGGFMLTVSYTASTQNVIVRLLKINAPGSATLAALQTVTIAKPADWSTLYDALFGVQFAEDCSYFYTVSKSAPSGAPPTYNVLVDRWDISYSGSAISISRVRIYSKQLQNGKSAEATPFLADSYCSFRDNELCIEYRRKLTHTGNSTDTGGFQQDYQPNSGGGTDYWINPHVYESSFSGSYEHFYEKINLLSGEVTETILVEVDFDSWTFHEEFDTGNGAGGPSADPGVDYAHNHNPVWAERPTVRYEETSFTHYYRVADFATGINLVFKHEFAGRINYSWQVYEGKPAFLVDPASPKQFTTTIYLNGIQISSSISTDLTITEIATLKTLSYSASGTVTIPPYEVTWVDSNGVWHTDTLSPTISYGTPAERGRWLGATPPGPLTHTTHQEVLGPFNHEVTVTVDDYSVEFFDSSFSAQALEEVQKTFVNLLQDADILQLARDIAVLSVGEASKTYLFDISSGSAVKTDELDYAASEIDPPDPNSPGENPMYLMNQFFPVAKTWQANTDYTRDQIFHSGMRWDSPQSPIYTWKDITSTTPAAGSAHAEHKKRADVAAAPKKYWLTGDIIAVSNQSDPVWPFDYFIVSTPGQTGAAMPSDLTVTSSSPTTVQDGTVTWTWLGSQFRPGHY